MNRNPTTLADGVSRRSVLAAGVTGLAVSASGCIDRARSVVTSSQDDQLSLSIMTVPADEDRENVRIVRHLETNLEAAGIDVSINMRSRSEVLEAVLIDHDFDCYVGRHPADYDPDFLYEALHSTYANESGWQNPFGFTSIGLDTTLEAQRRVDGDERKRKIGDVLRVLANEKPFEPICIPTENRVVRPDRFDGWDTDPLTTRTGYLGLEPQGDTEQLHALVTNSRTSRNLNPLRAELRDQDRTIGLLYDSLATRRDGELVPWLAESWEWVAPGDDPVDVEIETAAEASEAQTDEASEEQADDESHDPIDPYDEYTTVYVTLREDCLFHDGEPVTADDVAFTYEFLADTALGRATLSSPTPRYRSHVDAIESVTAVNDSLVAITTENGTAVTERAFTVPILPKHRWREQVLDRTDDENASTPQGTWSLITMDNVPATGSGPYVYESSSDRSHLTLERFDDHFTRRDDVDLPEATTEQLRFSVDPGSRSSVDRVASANADVTASMVGAHAVADLPEGSGATWVESSSQTFYHLGFNTRKTPFSNSHFRRALAQLVDKEWLAQHVFHGQAQPVATPVADEWVPEQLAWDGDDPVLPFAGSDGKIDVERAQAAFRRAGYRYDDSGRLLSRY